MSKLKEKFKEQISRMISNTGKFKEDLDIKIPSVKIDGYAYIPSKVSFQINYVEKNKVNVDLKVVGVNKLGNEFEHILRNQDLYKTKLGSKWDTLNITDLYVSAEVN